MWEGSSLNVRVVTSLDGLWAMVPAWWDLLDRAAYAQPTQTPLWALSWWKVFGPLGGRELRVVVVETPGGMVVGIVPLLRRWVMREALVPVATLELIGSGEEAEDEIFSEYIGAVAARGREAEVARAFAEALRRGLLGGWDELRMPAMSSEDPMVPLIAEGLRAQTISVGLQTTHDCPFIELPRTWDGYLSQLDGQKRYFVRRTLRDLDVWAGPGGAVVRRAETPAELEQGWRVLLALHGDRWQGSGAFRSARFRRFHDLVTSALLRGEGGTLDLLWLEVRGAPVAALYNIVYRGHVHFYQSGRAAAVPRGVRPGIALHLRAIRRAIELGYSSYDFLARVDQYKHQLAPRACHHLVTLTAIAPTMRARAGSDVRRTARMIADIAREISHGRGTPPARPSKPDRAPEPPSERVPRTCERPALASTRAPKAGGRS